MPAIVTITFNPALDKSTAIQELVPNRKLKCSIPVCEAGGGGINVARAIKKLGGEVVAVYLAGGNAGNEIARSLAAEGVESIITTIKGATRENLIVLDSSTNNQYLLDMPGPQVDTAEWQNCLNSIESLIGVEYIVASGSLPAGVPPDVFQKIVAIARKKNARLIVDTAGEGLKQAVKAGVYLIKPNLKELGVLAGREINEQTAAAAARELLQNGGCEAILVSMGPQGAILVTREQSLKIKPPAITVLSTVGAGDSLVAGIVLSLAKNKSLVEAVQYGVACGSAATMNSGTALCRKEDADHLFSILQKQEAVGS
ncbi:6-phosphofructokinase II [soil metagenome]